MKKYYVTALVAIAAIMVLLFVGIQNKYDGYVQEVSEAIDKAYGYANEGE